MSDFDRNATARWGTAGVARSAEYDLGLRSYMLGIYNHMTLALAISALVAVGIFMLGRTASPLVQTALPDARCKLGRDAGAAGLRVLPVVALRADELHRAARHLLGVRGGDGPVARLDRPRVQGRQHRERAPRDGDRLRRAVASTATRRSAACPAMGSFLVMGLIGLIVRRPRQHLPAEPAFCSFAISMIGVLIFAGLTAWDTQRLKEEYDYRLRRRRADGQGLGDGCAVALPELHQHVPVHPGVDGFARGIVTATVVTRQAPGPKARSFFMSKPVSRPCRAR